MISRRKPPAAAQSDLWTSGQEQPQLFTSDLADSQAADELFFFFLPCGWCRVKLLRDELWSITSEVPFHVPGKEALLTLHPPVTLKSTLGLFASPRSNSPFSQERSKAGINSKSFSISARRRSLSAGSSGAEVQAGCSSKLLPLANHTRYLFWSVINTVTSSRSSDCSVTARSMLKTAFFGQILPPRL